MTGKLPVLAKGQSKLLVCSWLRLIDQKLRFVAHIAPFQNKLATPTTDNENLLGPVPLKGLALTFGLKSTGVRGDLLQVSLRGRPELSTY